jgi:glycosyltransferase involved in cell wall biosynthesis
LRIAQLSTFDVAGGAESVAFNLFAEYRRRGESSVLVVGSVRNEAQSDVVLLDHVPYRGPWARRVNRVADSVEPYRGSVPGAGLLVRSLRTAVASPDRWLEIRRGHEDFDFPGTAHLLELVSPTPDVIHAHNLHGGYFDLRELPALSRARPFFLTLHDAWLLSGHCAHSFACPRWLIGCGNCPDLAIYPALPRDGTAFNWQRKRDIYSRSRLRVSAPCSWLMERVERSMLAEGMVESRIIPYGIDQSIFQPGSKTAARLELGLSTSTPTVMVAANGLRRSPWKNMPLLREAIRQAAGDAELLFLAVGEDAPAERIGNAMLRFVAPVPQAELAAWYRASDIYVHAARADTFPNTVLEALACGTPVVATAVGGIPEQIIDGTTGVLVPPDDARGFAHAVRALLADGERRDAMSAAAASHAREHFTLDRAASVHLDWYREAIEAVGEEGSTSS